MIEALQHRAETIKTLIGQQPERGAELLLDFARLYGSDEEIENEILIIQYELKAAPKLETADIERIKTSLSAFTDGIVAHYDPAKVELRLRKERELAEKMRLKTVPNDTVLVAENLEKKYRSSRFALHAAHLELRLGEITGLVGENATGKSTLLNILAGELAPAKGAVHYPLFDPKGRKNWADLKPRIAYVPQELTPWEGPLAQNLAFEAAVHGIKGQANKRAVDYIVQRLGLALHLDKSWRELSGGYKLRFALAKALVWQPQLLILDEPLAFLDIKTQGIVLEDLRSLAKRLTHPIAVLLSSQHIFETESVADQMWFMRGGQLEDLGSVRTFNANRDYNLFELGCPLSYEAFRLAMQDLSPLATEPGDALYFLKTPLSVTASEVLAHCQAKGIPLHYFRDISQSVKTKFYEGTLV